MATNNGNGTLPSTSRDQFYVPYSRTVQNIRTACMTTIQDLVDDRHPELTAPFAKILEALASVETEALGRLDGLYETKRTGVVPPPPPPPSDPS